MSNYLLDERNGIKKLINAKLGFNKKIILNAVNDLNDVSPNQKVFIIEQIMNKKLFPKPSMIEEIQKEQMIEDASKPFIKASDTVNDAKIDKIENQQLALQNESISKQVNFMKENIKSLLIHTLARQTNNGVLSLLDNVMKTYTTLYDYNLYDKLSQNDLANLYAINKSILNKTFLKNKKNIKELSDEHKNIYYFIKEKVNEFNTDKPEVVSKYNSIISSIKNPYPNISIFSIDELQEKINSPNPISKENANKYLKFLNAKFQNLSNDDSDEYYAYYMIQVLGFLTK